MERPAENDPLGTIRADQVHLNPKGSSAPHAFRKIGDITGRLVTSGACTCNWRRSRQHPPPLIGEADGVTAPRVCQARCDGDLHLVRQMMQPT
eukprot:COSAG01_NODE_44879_length_414_cov_1.863492_1_plen_92_part_10